MLKYVITILLIGITTFAYAQQQPTPNEQALSEKLMYEIQQGLSCNINLITIKNDLTKAQAKIKELEDKLKDK